MYYINAISSVSHQHSFDTLGFSNDLNLLDKHSELIKPNYKEIIGAKQIRRMSGVLRMSAACSINCLDKIEDEIGAIIVGTGFGCLADTSKFLTNFISLEGLVPPTSFIQSTHNTIAGQISLMLKNNGYNMTYTQNSVSFEMALEDAMMCIDEGENNVLLGAADEHIPFLTEVAGDLGFGSVNLTEGCTFLVLSKTKNKNTLAKVNKCTTTYKNVDKETFLNDFLIENKVDANTIDSIYFTNPFESVSDKLNQFKNEIDICKYAGFYPTNSALGFHIAVDQIHLNLASKILIYNNLNKVNLGLTLIESV